MIMQATALLFKGIVFASTLILRFLKTIFDAIIAGRQADADFRIAKMLHGTEYRQHSFQEVLNMVESRNLKQW